MNNKEVVCTNEDIKQLIKTTKNTLNTVNNQIELDIKKTELLNKTTETINKMCDNIDSKDKELAQNNKLKKFKIIAVCVTVAFVLIFNSVMYMSTIYDTLKEVKESQIKIERELKS